MVDSSKAGRKYSNWELAREYGPGARQQQTQTDYMVWVVTENPSASNHEDSRLNIAWFEHKLHALIGMRSDAEELAKSNLSESHFADWWCGVDTQIDIIKSEKDDSRACLDVLAFETTNFKMRLQYDGYWDQCDNEFVMEMCQWYCQEGHHQQDGEQESLRDQERSLGKFRSAWRSVRRLLLRVTDNTDGCRRMSTLLDVDTTAYGIVSGAYIFNKATALGLNDPDEDVSAIAEMQPFLDEIKPLFVFVKKHCATTYLRANERTSDEASAIAEKLSGTLARKMVKYFSAIGEVFSEGVVMTTGTVLSDVVQRDVRGESSPNVEFSKALLELVAKVK